MATGIGDSLDEDLLTGRRSAMTHALKAKLVGRWHRLSHAYVMWALMVKAPVLLQASQKLSIEDIRERTLRYVASMQMQKSGPGHYRYSESQRQPVLYASSYAVLTRHLYGDLDCLSDSERQQWIEYITSYQCDDGLFRDPHIANEQIEICDWWGTRHLTLHVLMALTALGAKAHKPLTFVKQFYDLDRLISWLDSLDFSLFADNTCSLIQNVGTFLQYARDFQDDVSAERSMECLFNWLDDKQDTSTGTWTEWDKNTRYGRSSGVQRSYHIWCLYFYDKRSLPYERMIDLLLKTQRWHGGFDWQFNSSACADIDSIDPLVRLYRLTEYRRTDVKSALRKALPWVMANINDDGGFAFRFHEPFFYGHELMSSKINESAMFPTWFRTLSLAYLSKALPDSCVANFDWQFLKCPGHQFWNE